MTFCEIPGCGQRATYEIGWSLRCSQHKNTSMPPAPSTPEAGAPGTQGAGLLCRTCNVQVAGMMEFTAAGVHAGHDIGVPEGHPLAKPTQTQEGGS